MDSNVSSMPKEGPSEFEQESWRLATSYYVCGAFFISVGTFLNLLLLVAILTSREMRSRLRNKVVCTILLVHLIESTFMIPATIASFYGKGTLGCVFYSAVINVQMIQEFLSNWFIVILLAVFIAQIQGFDLTSRLTPKAVIFGTIGLLVLPFAASLTVVPMIVNYNRDWDSLTGECFRPTFYSFYIFRSVDTVVPILLSILLVIVAAELSYRHGRSSGTMRMELISPGPEVDGTLPYVAVIVVAIICEVSRLILYWDPPTFYTYDQTIMRRVTVAIYIINDARVFLMPIAWIIFPDIRQRVKTWRPWLRPAAGNDVAVAYRKEEA